MYLGNQPALSYTSFAKQDFTTSATTSYTLDNPVTNANELALFINFVRQEPTTAYTATGTSLTLTSATSASDDMYCVFLGKAVQTVNPPSGSVGASQLVDGSIALAKLSATGTKDATTFLRGDNTFAVAGEDMTPAFHAYRTSGQSITTNTVTKVQLNLELFDTDGCYDNATNYRFTPTVAGKYYVYGNVSSSWTGSVGGYKNETFIYKNGSSTTGLTSATIFDFLNTAGLDLITGVPTVGIVDFNGSTDYVELYHLSNANTPFVAGSFGAYKIIE